MRDMINRVLIEEMGKNERIIMFGQDIADFPQKGKPTEGLKGKGGFVYGEKENSYTLDYEFD